MGSDLAGLLQQGRAALLDCDWATAASCFTQALAVEETPEALDGLGQARYWQHDYAEAVRLRERAYARYRERDDRRDAALVAVQLAQLHGLVHGNGVAVSGWLGHARRLLEDCGDCPEQGWVELFRGCICSDPVERERRCRAASEVGRRFRLPALEFDALGYVGKARVEQGAVTEGMGLIDEAVAAASSGLVGDPWAAGEIYCTLFHACEIAVDVRRADAWLATVDGYVERTGELPISAICRMHFGGLLTSAGRWEQAERELAVALDIYEDSYRGTRFEPLLRLAELRARQGRLEEAERLLEGHEDRPAAAVPRSRVLLGRGQVARAASVLDRVLTDDGPLTLAPALALRVEIALADDDVDEADRRTDRLEAMARATGLVSLRGLAARARARTAAASGDGAARDHLERALAAFVEAEMPLELAVTKLELAQLVAEAAPDVARGEARSALTVFQQVGASRHADAAAHLLRRLGTPARSGAVAEGPLTARQAEVLELLAEGLSNAEIAERLYISPRTAEHHVSNILATLGLRSRGEAAAHVLRRTHRGS